MALPIAPVVMPADLAGQTNGRLDRSLLVAVPGGGQLHHLAARAWVALVANAMAHAAMGLTYTNGGTYRTYAQQEALFRSRYAVGGIGGGCKRWLAQLWCKIKAALATAATPGESNHGWALAIDSAYDDDLTDGISPDDAAYILGHPGWDWLLANAHRFGFSWELQSEPWHIRYVAGDQVPAAVLQWEGFLAGHPEPDPDQPDPAPIEEDIMRAKYVPQDQPNDPWKTNEEKRRGQELAWFAAFDSGIVRHCAGPDTAAWPGAVEIPIKGGAHWNQLARAANAMSGAELALIPGK